MSHIKNVEALEKLMEICIGYGGTYKPDSTNLQITSLTDLLGNARQAFDEMYSAETLFENATNSRRVAFKEMRKLSTRMISVLKSCGAIDLTIDDAKSSIRKINGQRLTDRQSPPTENEEQPSEKKRMARGQSYAYLTEHFAKLVETINAEVLCNPLEPELTKESLNQFVARLRSLNSGVVLAFVQLNNARVMRNAFLYRNNTNLFKTAMAVKSYVKGAFGFSSAQYSEIAKIRFTK